MTTLSAVATCRARLRVRRGWLLGVAVATLLTALLAALTESPARASALAGSAALYGGLSLVAVLSGGWLGQELRSGTVDFWAQLPTYPPLLFVARFGAVALTALSLAAVSAVAVAGLLGLTGVPSGADRLLTALPGLLLVHLVFVSLLWAVGGWGVTGDSWAAVVLTGALAALELVARLRPSWLGPGASSADLIGLPLDDLGLAAALLSGQGGGSLSSLARVAAWMAAWAVVGAVGVHRTCSRPPRCPGGS